MTAATVTAPAADLSPANAGAQDPAATGHQLTYTIAATNTGVQDAAGVPVTNLLPASAVFGSMHTSQGSCSRTVSAQNKNKGGTLICRSLPCGITDGR